MNAVRQIVLTDNRHLLSTIPGRLVRSVFNEDSPYSDALFEVLKERQSRWTFDEWDAALAEIVSSSLTVAEFLALEHARAAA